MSTVMTAKNNKKRFKATKKQRKNMFLRLYWNDSADSL